MRAKVLHIKVGPLVMRAGICPNDPIALLDLMVLEYDDDVKVLTIIMVQIGIMFIGFYAETGEPETMEWME